MVAARRTAHAAQPETLQTPRRDEMDTTAAIALATGAAALLYTVLTGLETRYERPAHRRKRGDAERPERTGSADTTARRLRILTKGVGTATAIGIYLGAADLTAQAVAGEREWLLVTAVLAITSGIATAVGAALIEPKLDRWHRAPTDHQGDNPTGTHRPTAGATTPPGRPSRHRRDKRNPRAENRPTMTMTEAATTVSPSTESVLRYTKVAATRTRNWNLQRAIGRILAEEKANGATHARARIHENLGSLVKIETTTLQTPERGHNGGVGNRQGLAEEIAETCGAEITIDIRKGGNLTVWTITPVKWRRQVPERLFENLNHSPIPIEASGRAVERTEFPGCDVLAEERIDGDTYYLCRIEGWHCRRQGLGTVLAGMQILEDPNLPAVEGELPGTDTAAGVGVMIRTGPENALNAPKTGTGTKLEREAARIEMAGRARTFAAREIGRLTRGENRFLTLARSDWDEVRSWGADIPEIPSPLTRWRPETGAPGAPPPIHRLDDDNLAVIDTDNFQTNELETLARALDIEGGRPDGPRVTLASSSPRLAGYRAYNRLPHVTAITMLAKPGDGEGGPVEVTAETEQTEDGSRRLLVGVTLKRTTDLGTIATEKMLLETDILLPVPPADTKTQGSRRLNGALVDTARLTATADEVARILANAYPREDDEDDKDATFDAGCDAIAAEAERALLWKTAKALHGEDRAALILVEDTVRRHCANEGPPGSTILVTITRADEKTDVSARYAKSDDAATPTGA